MAAANYSGTKAEIEEYEQVRRMEERHVELAPEGEREEIRQIFEAKGFSGEALDSAVDVITGTRERWIDTMMTEEHGLPPIARSPARAALMTFLAFLLCGAIPLLPFIAGAPAAISASTAHDRRDVLFNRVAPEPLVAGAMVAVGFGDLPDRDLRRGLGLPHRRRRRRSRRTDPLAPTARLRLCATMPAMAIKEPSFTIGIEEEYLLVDRTTRDLAQEPPPALLAKCEEALRGQVSPEFLRSQIEVGTRVCTSIQEARDQLAHLRATVGRIAGEFGLAPIASSTHPFAQWQSQHHTDKERYNVLAQDLQLVARRLVISGMHVHAADHQPARHMLEVAGEHVVALLVGVLLACPFGEGMSGCGDRREPELAGDAADRAAQMDQLVAASCMDLQTRVPTSICKRRNSGLT